jgi:hypothetical protein
MGRQHGFEPVEEQRAVRQAGEVVVHGIVQQALFGGLEFSHVGQRADQPHDFAIRADDGTRLEREPQIMPVRAAQPEILHQAAAALVEHAVERGAEAVAIERVQHFQPGIDG